MSIAWLGRWVTVPGRVSAMFIASAGGVATFLSTIYGGMTFVHVWYDNVTKVLPRAPLLYKGAPQSTLTAQRVLPRAPKRY